MSTVQTGFFSLSAGHFVIVNFFFSCNHARTEHGYFDAKFSQGESLLKGIGCACMTHFHKSEHQNCTYFDVIHAITSQDHQLRVIFLHIHQTRRSWIIEIIFVQQKTEYKIMNEAKVIKKWKYAYTASRERWKTEEACGNYIHKNKTIKRIHYEGRKKSFNVNVCNGRAGKLQLNMQLLQIIGSLKKLSINRT